ncbi:MAG: hypothetical protein CVV04_00585 [Firmicutes bacterium HGW-Firmicutes-9]|jgi:hypothetical protein|nr:MAG: hypothetical protein CVV04_00585 [Firmicutes bacterium HGW-Firmicutes-9]
MACFLVSAAEAAIVTVTTQIVLAHENKLLPKYRREAEETSEQHAAKIPFSHKLRWLSNLLWGGSLQLAFEHVWHGEIVPWTPFLTAAATPAEATIMLHEMSTVGVGMALLVTAVWGAMVLVSSSLEKKTTLPALAE